VAISLFLLFAGSLLHFFVKGVLVRNTVLCKDGIYRLTRHPYYTSNYLIDVSLCLLSGNQYLLVAYPFLFFWAYGPTFRKEEAHLMTLYPEEYHRYGLETPRSYRTPAPLATGRDFSMVFLSAGLRRMSLCAS